MTDSTSNLPPLAGQWRLSLLLNLLHLLTAKKGGAPHDGQ